MFAAKEFKSNGGNTSPLWRIQDTLTNSEKKKSLLCIRCIEKWRNGGMRKVVKNAAEFCTPLHYVYISAIRTGRVGHLFLLHHRHRHQWCWQGKRLRLVTCIYTIFYIFHKPCGFQNDNWIMRLFFFFRIHVDLTAAT